jgi:peroxiredoxin
MPEASAHPPLICGPYSNRFLAVFELPASDGRTVRLWDYRQRRNLVLFFHHGAGCLRCRGELSRFGRYYAAYRERDAEILAIGPDEPARAAQLAAALKLPFPLLSDSSGAVAARQQPLLQSDECPHAELPRVLVSSRVEELWAAWAPADDLDLPSQQEVLDWLEFVVIQCHNGCGRPEWGQI